MKVWRWLDHRLERFPGRPWDGQVEVVVAAPSKAAAARSVGESDPRRLFNLSETWNEEDCAVAMAKPGTAFWTHLNGRPRTWREW